MDAAPFHVLSIPPGGGICHFQILMLRLDEPVPGGRAFSAYPARNAVHYNEFPFFCPDKCILKTMGRSKWSVPFIV
jgi:hypothetical protein